MNKDIDKKQWWDENNRYEPFFVWVHAHIFRKDYFGLVSRQFIALKDFPLSCDVELNRSNINEIKDMNFMKNGIDILLDAYDVWIRHGVKDGTDLRKLFEIEEMENSSND